MSEQQESENRRAGEEDATVNDENTANPSRPPPSPETLEICRGLETAKLTTLTFPSAYTDFCLVARSLRHNESIKGLALIIDWLPDDNKDNILENFAWHVQHNPRLQFISLKGYCRFRSRLVLQRLTMAISKNESIKRLILGNATMGFYDGHCNLADSKIREVQIDFAQENAAIIPTALQAFEACNVVITSLDLRLYGRSVSPANGRALASFVAASRSLTGLSIHNDNGSIMAYLMPAIHQSTTLTRLHIIYSNHHSSLPKDLTCLERIVGNAMALKRLLFCVNFSTGDEVLRLVNLVMTNASIVDFSLIARETIIVYPESLQSLFRESSHLQKVSLKSADFSEIPAEVFGSISNPALTSLSLSDCDLSRGQILSILESTTRGRMSSLESLHLTYKFSFTREDLNYLATCLIGNPRLHVFHFNCRDLRNSKWCDLSFDRHRHCKVDARKFDDASLVILLEWLQETPEIVFSELLVHSKQSSTLEIIRLRVLGQFDPLTKLHLVCSVGVSPDVKANFLSALRQNTSLLTITLQRINPDGKPEARFVSRRNRVKALLTDPSPECHGLWARVLRQMNSQCQSATFIAVREGLGHCWLPDAS